MDIDEKVADRFEDWLKNTINELNCKEQDVIRSTFKYIKRTFAI